MQTRRGELVHELTALRRLAGLPSLRGIATEAGCSHTTVAKILAHDGALPSWRHTKAVVTCLNGNVEHVRHLWIAAQHEANASTVVAAPRARSSAGIHLYIEMATLLLVLVGVMMFGSMSPINKQWTVAAGAQTAFYSLGAVLLIVSKKWYNRDARGSLTWLAAGSALAAAGSAVQLIVPHSDTGNLNAGGLTCDILFMLLRVCLIGAVLAYLRARSTVVIRPWARLIVSWTPLVWILAILMCYGLISVPVDEFAGEDVVDLVVSATLFTLDVEFAVVALVVMARYAPKRHPFFLMLLIAGVLWLSDVAWCLTGPHNSELPFGSSIGYIVAGAAIVAISRHPDLRTSPESRTVRDVR